MLLLPEAIDDCVGPDNPVRFIEAFVDHPDLDEVVFERVVAKVRGRPGHDPADLLKLCIHGYLNRPNCPEAAKVAKSQNIFERLILR